MKAKKEMEMGQLHITDEELVCFVCGAKTHRFKWSFIGQIKIGLCSSHSDCVPYFSFGPQFPENAQMGVLVLNE
jgi:hypothetical protein